MEVKNMKKILPILVVLAMAISAVPAVLGAELPDDVPTGDCAWDDEYCIENIPTSVIVQQTGQGGTGVQPPVIKCKWEYDLDFQCPVEDCPECDPCDNLEDFFTHDACPCLPGLQVQPTLHGDTTVGYYAVVTHPYGVSNVDHVYADIWHPDGKFKYQIELFPIGFDTGGVYNKQVAIEMWEHVWDYHSDLVKINSVWASTLTGFIPGSIPQTPITADYDIWDELNQEEAYIYAGQADINYCQPGGWYYVGVNAYGFGSWSEYLYNRFWYIPTAGIDVDFSTIDYGTVVAESDKWVGGDIDFSTLTKPTIRNIGNTPVNLYVWQNDMGFGATGGVWNVRYDVRLTADGQVRNYYPNDVDTISPLPNPTWLDDPDNFYPGVRIPGTLPLCTTEKLDFSIHVNKALLTTPYTGLMNLCALMDMGSYIWQTPLDFQGFISGVSPTYIGPPNPGPLP
jgi:hypothetical protein